MICAKGKQVGREPLIKDDVSSCSTRKHKKGKNQGLLMEKDKTFWKINDIFYLFVNTLTAGENETISNY